MAKLLLTTDDSVYSFNGKFYAESRERYDFYQRYLRVFDELRLVTRCVYENDLKQGRIELDSNKIEYIAIPFFSGPVQYSRLYFRVGKTLQHITDGCDAAVLRLPSTIGQRVYSRVMNAKLPYAIEIVSCAKDAYKCATSTIHKFLWFIIHKQMSRACFKSNGVSCVTEKYLQRYYFSKKSDAFYASYSSLALNQNFYTSPREYPLKKRFIISNVANQIEYNGCKGFNEIIMALKVLKDRGIVVIFRFAGNDYHNGVEKLLSFAQEQGVSEQLEYAGYLSRENLDIFLSEVDIFVMPTHFEGLPRIIVEASAKGLPVISSPVSGVPELVSKHFLVDYEDVETLADRIEELIKDKVLYEAASAENFNHSLQYEASILEKRRDVFYSKLKSCIK